MRSCTPTAGSLVIALGCALAGCSGGASDAPEAAEPAAKATKVVVESQLNIVELSKDSLLKVKLGKVTREDMPRARPYGATLSLPTDSAVLVSAPLAGTIRTVPKKGFPKAGQKVTENEGLLELLPLLSPERSVLTSSERVQLAEARNTLAQAKIDADDQFQQATVQLDAARTALARAQKLLKDKAGTARAVDEAEAQVKLAEQSLEAARVRKKHVESVSLDEEAGTLKAISIQSPLTGIVSATDVKAGGMVAAGAALFHVINDRVLWVKAPVYVGDLPEIDLTCNALLAPLDGRPTGKEIEVEPLSAPPTASPLAASVDLYFRLPNDSRKFRAGEKVTVHISLKVKASQLVVPWQAVYHDIYGGQWVYEHLGDLRYVRRRVEIGWVKDGKAVLTRGLKEGTRVVVTGVPELAGFEFGHAH